MRGAAFYLASDPEQNRQFSRRWADPPNPGNEKRRPGQGAAQLGNIGNNNTPNSIETALEAQAKRWLAQRR